VIWPPIEDFVSANGVNLQYFDWGGRGPALILIHGLGDNPRVFDDLVPAFTDRFRVLAYARRGHGGSEAKPPYDTWTLTEDLRGLMDALRIANANLVGWSMGGNEITAMAANHAGRVCRIVYLDAAYDWTDPDYRTAIAALPGSLLHTPATAMTSFDEYRAFQKAAHFTGLADMGRIETYLRESVIVGPDGALKLRIADREDTMLSAMMTDPPRAYARVRCPALAIYPESMFNLRAANAERRRDALDYERTHMIPFRKKSIDCISREIANVEIVRVPGTHTDFFLTSREFVVSAMQRFLSDCPSDQQ
jgi:pimeloyl-ACP methyl ester carboxylesterase